MAFRTAGAGFSFAAATAGAGLDQTSEAERVAQKKALDDVLSVLLSAGYFRARIPQLAPFDKVVGGLCWAISSSGAAVDVDLFYDEELALGQKIQLCEVIVKVLRVMQCPSPLQAHQIQGGDFVACFPVVQWLIKKVLEYRRITGDTIRTASESAFHRAYAPAAAPRAIAAAASYGPAIPASSVVAGSAAAAAASSAAAAGAGAAAAALIPSRPPAAEAYAAQVDERYKPTRRYRKLPSLWSVPLPAEARVQSCLLEFGERAPARAAAAGGDDDADGATAAGGAGKAGRGTGTDFERKFAALQRAARAEEEAAAKAALARERGLLEQMGEAKAGVSGASLGAFVDLQSEELRRAAADYAVREEELRALAESGGLMANTKMGRAAAHGRRVAALQKRIDSAGDAKRDAEASLAAAGAQVDALKASLAKVRRLNGRAEAEIAKLDAQVEALPAEERATLKKLFDAYTRTEALRDQEARFKASCKVHLAELTARLEELRAAAESGEAARQLAEMTAVHAEAAARLERARAAVAARTREVDRLARAIDEIPSRTELVQYERRFGELADEVAEKLDETRKYYAVYNSLARKRDYIGKEDNLVTSMLANFASLKSKTARQGYLDQCAGIITTIEESLSKQNAVVDGKRAARDAKAAEVQRLVDAQRSYFKAVKEFQEECDRNDALVRAIARRGASAAAAGAGGE